MDTGKILQKITSKAGWQNGLVTKQFNKKPVRARILFEANKNALLEYIGFLT